MQKSIPLLVLLLSIASQPAVCEDDARSNLQLQDTLQEVASGIRNDQIEWVEQGCHPAQPRITGKEAALLFEFGRNAVELIQTKPSDPNSSELREQGVVRMHQLESLLLEAMQDDTRFVAAHVILTHLHGVTFTRSIGQWQGEGYGWSVFYNGLLARTTRYSAEDGTWVEFVVFPNESEQRERLEQTWSAYVALANPLPVDE